MFDFSREAYLPKVPKPFLVEGWLHRSTTLIFGQTTAGKSMLAQWLALPLASGGAPRWPTTEQRWERCVRPW